MRWIDSSMVVLCLAVAPGCGPAKDESSSDGTEGASGTDDDGSDGDGDDGAADEEGSGSGSGSGGSGGDGDAGESDDGDTETSGGDGGSADGGSADGGSADGGSADGGNSCVPGRQVECPCIGGGSGVQVCNEDGTAYGDCMCPEKCDALADCSMCTACAGAGACAKQGDACANNPMCKMLSECLGNCGANDNMCHNACAMQFRDGVDDYNAWAMCVLDECPSTC